MTAPVQLPHDSHLRCAMMTDQSEPFVQKVATVLPFVMPAIGGGIGVVLVNMSNLGNPFIYISTGALLGWLVARLIAKPLEAMADRQRSKR